MVKKEIKKKVVKRKPPKSTGRTKITIDFQILENLLKIQCSKNECSCVLGCSEDTIEARIKETYKCTFSELKARFEGSGKATLRRYQWEHAKNHYGMAIFLGKVHLGQKENDDIDVEAVEKRFQFILQVIKSNVKDPDILGKIADEIEKFKV